MGRPKANQAEHFGTKKNAKQQTGTSKPRAKHALDFSDNEDEVNKKPKSNKSDLKGAELNQTQLRNQAVDRDTASTPRGAKGSHLNGDSGQKVRCFCDDDKQTETMENQDGNVVVRLNVPAEEDHFPGEVDSVEDEEEEDDETQHISRHKARSVNNNATPTQDLDTDRRRLNSVESPVKSSRISREDFKDLLDELINERAVLKGRHSPFPSCDRDHETVQAMHRSSGADRHSVSRE